MKLATSYFGSRILRHVKNDMGKLREQGFSRIVHTFSENDLYYYPGTMRDIVQVSIDLGFDVLIDPWGVAGIFGGEAFSRWITEQPAISQVGASGRHLGGACLNNPILITQMTEWLDAAAATGAQWVFWDEPHWSPGGSPRNPEGEHCVCDFCLEKAGSRGITESFRAKSLVLFLARMVNLATDRGMKSSICVMPQGMAGQPGLDWPEIAALPGLSEFGTDPYWQAFNIREAGQRDRFIDKNSTAAREVSTTAGVESMLWTQAFRVKAGDEDDLLDGSKRIMNHNPDTIAIWGFEACAHMSTLACADTDKIWQGLIDIYKGISK
jgi:hypothetical protein